MNVSFALADAQTADTIAVTVSAGGGFGPFGRVLDEKTAGTLTRAVKASRFTGKAGETLSILAPAGLTAERVVLIGHGDPGRLDPAGAESLGGTLVGALAKSGATTVRFTLDLAESAAGSADLPAPLTRAVARGVALRAYTFDLYKTTEATDKRPSLETVLVSVVDPDRANADFQADAAVIDAVAFARDLVSEPANVLYPETLAERCRGLGAFGIGVEVLEPPQLRELGMGALLGVAQGSARAPRVVVLRYDGDPTAADPRPLALIGKGVTFDSGGISIKPAGGMEEMKWDMAGAGAVIGAMRAIAGRKAKANVVGIVGLVENMPSGTAQRPGDVVTTLSGQTVEVINTDAEGRLVLADCVWYARDRFKPRTIIDLATLTGAIIVALGHQYAGLFSSSDTLAAELAKAGDAVGEKVWRMPLGEAYDKDIASDIADMRNTGTSRDGGSITAAQFIKRFVKDTDWAHIDIAGMAWSKKDSDTAPKGATGYGVRLLDRYIANVLER